MQVPPNKIEIKSELFYFYKWYWAKKLHIPSRSLLELWSLRFLACFTWQQNLMSFWIWFILFKARPNQQPPLNKKTIFWSICHIKHAYYQLLDLPCVKVRPNSRIESDWLDGTLMFTFMTLAAFHERILYFFAWKLEKDKMPSEVPLISGPCRTRRECHFSVNYLLQSSIKSCQRFCFIAHI